MSEGSLLPQSHRAVRAVRCLPGVLVGCRGGVVVGGGGAGVSTERIIDAAATMLETWAKPLHDERRPVQEAIRDGDPDGSVSSS